MYAFHLYIWVYVVRVPGCHNFDTRKIVTIGKINLHPKQNSLSKTHTWRKEINFSTVNCTFRLQLMWIHGKTPTYRILLVLRYYISKHNIHSKELMFNKVSDERSDSQWTINVWNLILSKTLSKLQKQSSRVVL